MLPRLPRCFAADKLCSGVPIVAIGVLMAMIASCAPADDGMSDGEMMEPDQAPAIASQAIARSDARWEPEFTAAGELLLPEAEIWREWPYIGTPLTPNALNDGEAPFPEFHAVYIDPVSWEHWRRTGTFREGTVLAKELVSVLADSTSRPDASTVQVSGRGYFMDEFIGFEIAHKSAERYPDEPGNWAYYTFGHHPLPYAASTPQQPVEACNVCHQASAADDYVFTQFYPVLKASRGGR